MSGLPTKLDDRGQGPSALTVGAGGGCLDMFFSRLSFLFIFLPLSEVQVGVVWTFFSLVYHFSLFSSLYLRDGLR